MKFKSTSLIITMIVLLTGPLISQAEEAMVLPIKRLSMDTALKIAKVTIAACRKKGVNVAVTVVDRGGHPQVVLRDTLAMDLTLRISRDKAYTAMSFNSASGDLADRFKGAGSILKVDGVLASRGGLPINLGGTIMGGVGVSGAPSGKTDEDCAKAGLDSVIADIEMSM
jgi:uncharacterized protein GlcG (DUF336 family)